MVYLDVLVILFLGIVSGAFLASELGEMLTVLTQGFVTWSARLPKRRQARAEEAMVRAGRQVRSIRR